MHERVGARSKRRAENREESVMDEDDTSVSEMLLRRCNSICEKMGRDQRGEAANAGPHDKAGVLTSPGRNLPMRVSSSGDNSSGNDGRAVVAAEGGDGGAPVVGVAAGGTRRLPLSRTPIDHLPLIDAQLAQSHHLVRSYAAGHTSSLALPHEKQDLDSFLVIDR
ncbi:homeobox protein knotted-1-like 3 [Canna indica]|uniref:Homeobox protein knotted-1-like 3 n=1 Tax=Canna indica TaxID=4628 RepID=A0AAQ3KBK2_9LILI|nr:homeobox protein knotted-1-like 3 [Canna indica]